jgi:hypothetical protein
MAHFAHGLSSATFPGPRRPHDSRRFSFQALLLLLAGAGIAFLVEAGRPATVSPLPPVPFASPAAVARGLEPAAGQIAEQTIPAPVAAAPAAVPEAMAAALSVPMVRQFFSAEFPKLSLWRQP